MKKILLFVLLCFCGFAYGQTPSGYTKINARYKWTAGIMDSGFHVPQYNGVPSGTRTGVWAGDGAIAVDTTNHYFYIFSGGAWVKIAKFSDITTPTWQQTLTAGSTLTGDNLIQGGAYNLRFRNVNNFAIGDLLSTSIYTTFNFFDSATVANASSLKSRGLQMNRNIVMTESGINISDKEGANFALVFRLRDTATLLPVGSDLIYGSRSGIFFKKNTDYSGRSIVRSGNGSVAFDATAAHLASVDFPDNGSLGNIYYKGYVAANTSYLYGYNTADTIENYIGYYSTGSNLMRVLRGYNYFGDGIGANVDSVWGIYQRAEQYNYLSSSLKIGGITNRFAQDDNGVADSSLQNNGSFHQVGNAKFDAKIHAPNLAAGNGTKAVRWDATNGFVLADTSTGGSTTPAGNFGNLQINRNSAFATPASDSLDWESATGLGIKGDASLTGGVTVGNALASSTGKFTLTSGIPGLWFGDNSTSISTGNFQMCYDNSQKGLYLNAPSTGYIHIRIANDYNNALLWSPNSRLGVGFAYNGNPTAMVHIKAGTATASTSPLKFTSGTNLTTAEAGAMEYNGTSLFFSPSTTRLRTVLTDNSIPSNGQLAIGNGVNYTNATLASADASITITNGAGTIDLAAGSQGTYMPTCYLTTNVADTTTYTTHYKRIGDWIHVWGEVDIDATAATTMTEMGMSLPVGTSTTNTYDLAGTAAFEDNTAVQIAMDVANGRAKWRFTPQTNTMNKYSFHFSYKFVTP